MAINKNHEFEDLEGIKCAIVEKNVSSERLAFIKPLLELNKYVVIVAKSPAAKAAVSSPESVDDTAAIPVIETYTVGVTNVVFNIINALMGRALKTRDGKVVTSDFWFQKKPVSLDEIPYFEKSDKW